MTAVLTADAVTLRRLRWWDLPTVLGIERDTFPSDAWTIGMFLSELADLEGRRYRVAVSTQPEPEIVGYAGIHVYAGEAYLNTIAVRRDWWRRGVGGLLLDHMVGLADAADAVLMGLEVAASNDAAQHLYASRGFEPVGLRKGYYQATGEDAVVMVRERVR